MEDGCEGGADEGEERGGEGVEEEGTVDRSLVTRPSTSLGEIPWGIRTLSRYHSSVHLIY